MVSLLYPKKAMSTNDVPHCRPLYEELGSDGVKVFKNIFDNNNQELRDKFFRHPLIIRLWPILNKEYKYEHCFCKASPNEGLMSTYSVIEGTLRKAYNI